MYNSWDLKFAVKIARFYDTAKATKISGVVMLNNLASASSITYTGIYPNIEDLTLTKTDISYELSRPVSSTDNYYVGVKNLETFADGSTGIIANTATETSRTYKSLKLRARLNTTNPYVSPYIDLDRANFVLTKNIINNSTYAAATGTVGYSTSSNVVTGYGTSFTTQLTSGSYIKTSTNEYRKIASISSNTSLVVANNFNVTSNGVSLYYNMEENPTESYTSLSRYMTRVVTLNNGFDSSDLVVYLDVNRLKGTDVKVYYKILNSADQDKFINKFWTEMDLDGIKVYTSDPNSYTEQKYIVSSAGKAKKPVLLSGTANTTSGSTSVTGTNTSYLQEIKVADTIAFGTNKTEGVVGSIANNTSLTLTLAAAATGANQDIYRLTQETIAYTTPDGITYNQYKYFAIKVVFLSSDIGFVPKVKNLRAVALA
jgi:hypothetical protein